MREQLLPSGRPVGAPHQLGFSTLAASVHSAHHALHRPRLGILDEPGGPPGFAEVFIEDLGVESPGEESAFVPERDRHQHQNAGQLWLFDTHETMLP